MTSHVLKKSKIVIKLQKLPNGDGKTLFSHLISVHRDFCAKFRRFVNFRDFRGKFANYFCILKANK